jgi:RNAse (barnase) inhibitor barstar
MVLVNLDTRGIRDWETFHDEFCKLFGFPGFYGRNMNAWIDCMADLDEPGAQMTSLHVKPGEILVLHLDHVDELRRRFPEGYNAIIECSAFVNYRKIEAGEPPVLALSFCK